MAAPAFMPDVSDRLEAETEGLSRLEALFREHYPAVARWARVLGVSAAAAEDVAQQVFLIAQRKLEQLDGASSTRAWLFGITRRACANHRRARARARVREEQADPPSDYPPPERAAERAQAAQMLQCFLDGLPEQQRLAFVLYEVDGLDAPEVGRMLGIDAQTVHARVRIARKKLERFVKRQQSAAQRSALWNS